MDNEVRPAPFVLIESAQAAQLAYECLTPKAQAAVRMLEDGILSNPSMLAEHPQDHWRSFDSALRFACLVTGANFKKRSQAIANIAVSRRYYSSERVGRWARRIGWGGLAAAIGLGALFGG